MKGMSFDPGKYCGWSAGQQRVLGERANLLGCGILDRGFSAGRDDRVEEALDLLMRFQPDVVFVETVSFVVPREGFGTDMAGNLVRAATLGGRLYQLAKDHGFEVHEVAAEAWRKAIVGKSTAENAEIKPLVIVRYLNWPPVSNNHERDAGGLLSYGLERELRKLANPKMFAAMTARSAR